MRDFFRSEKQEDESLPETPGVIDTIGLGYSYLISYPYVIAIPILLDLYLWLGLRVSSDPAIIQLAVWIRSFSWDGDSVVRFFDRFLGINIFELASLQLYTFRVPTFIPLISELPNIGTSSWDPMIDSAPWWAVIIIGIAAIGVSLLIGSSYLTWMAGILREPASPLSFRAVLGTAWQLLSWVFMLLVIFLLIAGPVLLTIIAFNVAGLPQSGFIALLLVFPTAWGFVFFFFSVYAIAVDRLSALESLRASYQVVRHNFVQTLGFIAMFFIVTSGFPFIWRLMISNPAGTLIAIIGNAFIASGMIVSAMVFYRDRAAILPDMALSQEG